MKDWMPPEYDDWLENGFPVTDPHSADYNPRKDPFNPEAYEWALIGPELVETDEHDSRRNQSLHEIPIQYKTVTQANAFRTIVASLQRYHRGVNKDRITLDSRFVEDLGLDSLDLNELSVVWEWEFNIHGQNRHQRVGFTDLEVQSWVTLRDVVDKLMIDPRAMCNEPLTPEHDECYEWDHALEPEWGLFTKRINPDGTEGRPEFNPSGLPEFDYYNKPGEADGTKAYYGSKELNPVSPGSVSVPFTETGFVEGAIAGGKGLWEKNSKGHWNKFAFEVHDH